MKQHLKKFSSETEYNAYINGNPVLPNVSLIGDSGKVKFITEDYYTKQYLTLEILEDGYIGLKDTEDIGLTVQYNKNNNGWTNLTSSPCNLLTEETTVDGKSGTYTFGGYDKEFGAYYWENNGDKLFYDRGIPSLKIGDSVFDSEYNEYEVLTIKDTPRPITSEITINEKSGTYTYGGFDAEMGMYYWENNGDKLYYDENYVVIGNSVFDSEYNEYQVLTTKDAPSDSFISVTEGDVLCFKGDNPTYSGTYFVSTGKFNIKGNIMSIIDSTNFTTATTLIEQYAFYGLFSGTEIVSAKNLVLPATTLTNYCYNSMFSKCISLVTAPKLPATTLSNGCYANMFNGCTSLVTAPKLPATTLAISCYSNMFSKCTSLVTAPELPATTLAVSCYNLMFNGCSSLNHIKCLATIISANYCTSMWVNSVSSTGTFVKNASMSSWTTGYNGIPSGWTVQDAS